MTLLLEHLLVGIILGWLALEAWKLLVAVWERVVPPRRDRR